MFNGLTEVSQVLVVVQGGSLFESSGPGVDTGDWVCRGLTSFLVDSVMSGDCSVGGFSLADAVFVEQFTCHHAQRPETLLSNNSIYPEPQRRFKRHRRNFCRPKRSLRLILRLMRPCRRSICVRTKFCWLRITFYIRSKYPRKCPWIGRRIALRWCSLCSNKAAFFFWWSIWSKSGRNWWLSRWCCTWLIRLLLYHCSQKLGIQFKVFRFLGWKLILNFRLPWILYLCICINLRNCVYRW